MPNQQLTLDQIEQLNQISDPVARRRYSVFFQLPQDLQIAFESEDTTNSVWDITRGKYDLADGDISKVARIIGLIFLGELPIKSFIAEVKDKLKVNVAQAQAIAQDINQAIFQPVRNSLMTVHGIAAENSKIQETNSKQFTSTNIQNTKPVNPYPPRSIQQPVKLVPPANEPNYEAVRRRNEVLNKLKNPPGGPTARPARYSFAIPPRRSVNNGVKKKRNINRYDGFFT